MRLPTHGRSGEVFASVMDLYSKDRGVLSLDPLYLSQELVMHGYFNEYDPPTLVDVGHAQDLIRYVER
jgi:hypothetical protein